MPAKLTKPLARVLARAAAGGATGESLAGLAGVHRSTIQQWKKEGEANLEDGDTKTAQAQFILQRDKHLGDNHARLYDFYASRIDEASDEGAEARKWLTGIPLMFERVHEVRARRQLAQAQLRLMEQAERGMDQVNFSKLMLLIMGLPRDQPIMLAELLAKLEEAKPNGG